MTIPSVKLKQQHESDEFSTTESNPPSPTISRCSENFSSGCSTPISLSRSLQNMETLFLNPHSVNDNLMQTLLQRIETLEKEAKEYREKQERLEKELKDAKIPPKNSNPKKGNETSLSRSLINLTLDKKAKEHAIRGPQDHTWIDILTTLGTILYPIGCVLALVEQWQNKEVPITIKIRDTAAIGVSAGIFIYMNELELHKLPGYIVALIPMQVGTNYMMKNLHRVENAFTAYYPKAA